MKTYTKKERFVNILKGWRGIVGQYDVWTKKDEEIYKQIIKLTEEKNDE